MGIWGMLGVFLEWVLRYSDVCIWRVCGFLGYGVVRRGIFFVKDIGVRTTNEVV